jgi:predicted Zn-dependent peptidase
MIDSQIPGFSRFVLGELKDLKKIGTKELTKFYRATFIRNNAVIGLQSKSKPRGEFLRVLEEIAKRFQSNSRRPLSWPKEKLKNQYKVGYFHEPDRQGTQIILAYFTPSPLKINYRDNILFKLQRNLISKVAWDYLRIEKGIVYGFEPFSDGTALNNYDIEGFHYTVNPKDIKRSLNMVYEIIYSKAETFLRTKQGERWFANFLSSVIFPTTKSFDGDYAENKAFSVLYGYEIQRFEKVEEEAEKVTIDAVLKYLKKNLQSIPIHIFISSPVSRKLIMKAVHTSQFHKHWSSRIPKKLKK